MTTLLWGSDDTWSGRLVGLLHDLCIILYALYLQCMFPLHFPLKHGDHLVVSPTLFHPPNVGWLYNASIKFSNVILGVKSLSFCDRSFGEPCCLPLVFVTRMEY